VDLRHTVEGLQSVNKLTSSAFALCVLLGATTPSSAEETVCRRYDAEHENNLLAYNGCMQEQRIARLKVATWIERVADIKDAWSEEGTIDIAVARQKGERWALILDECMAQKGEDGLIDMLVTLKCVEWQERVSQKLGEPLKPRSWTEWLRSWMPSWLPTF
jgi:hypothetical protein